MGVEGERRFRENKGLQVVRLSQYCYLIVQRTQEGEKVVVEEDLILFGACCEWGTWGVTNRDVWHTNGNLYLALRREVGHGERKIWSNYYPDNKVG